MNLSFDDRNLHLHILDRSVGGAGGHSGNFVDDLKAFDDLSEDGIVAVEVRRATDGGVSLNLFFGERFAEALSHHVELARLPYLTLNDVELVGRGSLLGVDLVPFAGGGERTFAVEEALDKFGREAIARVLAAEHLSRFGVARVGVATLDHEVVDNAMEEKTVEEALIYQL